MRKILISLLLLALLIAAPGGEANRAAGRQAEPPKPTQPPAPGGGEDVRAAIEAAVQQALGVNAEAVPAILMYEEVIQDIRISDDGEWALVFMAFADPESGEILATEPGLAFARRTAGEWNAILPAAANWPETLQNLPEGLLSPEEKADWWVMYTEAYEEAAAVGTLGGYYLPWNGGERMRLTNSTGHDSYTPSGSAHYAFDFANGTMFPIHAAKPGTVHSVRVECKNGDEQCSNWIILEDTTTTPTTYQLYLHLAQESVPPEIRAKGTRIRQGQFLALADDTGASTGHHLHFHVHTNPNTWWAPSVDITFADVAINGGRPRRAQDQRYCTRSTDVCVQTQDFYVSGNVFHGDATPPEGGITAPSPGAVLTSPTVTLKGWASDVGTGVQSSQFRAYYNDLWHDIGSPIPTTTNPSTTWDMCAAGVPQGPVALALRVLDKDGNEAPGYPGLRLVVNSASCPPPPTCNPGPDQVALFSEPDYGGACVVINKGTYNNAASLVPVGDNNTASIRLGANVQAQLYSELNRTGHREVLAASDLSLADNAIGMDTLSSIVVENRVSQTGLGLTAAEDGTIPEETVAPEAVTAVTAPWSDDMQKGYNGWTTPGTTNMWDQAYAGGQNIAWWYGQDGAENYRTSTNRNYGNLLTPVINIPNDGKTYYLRFRYRYQTESPGVHWDWRKLQISVNGGAFTDLLQLSDDPMDTWLQSPAISLKDYNGKALQFRFQFDTRDGFYNDFNGWFIDDFKIDTTAPPACADGRDTPDQALSLTPGTPVQGEICPGADVDYYKFSGSAGERIGAVVEGLSAGGSKLDATLALLDADGRQILAYSDDPTEGRADPWLSYQLKRSGTYYLRVQAWDHPSAGSAEHTYTLRLFKDSTPPTATGFQSVEAGKIYRSGQSIPVRISASDTDSGVSHVTFMWHSGDWEKGKWVVQGDDWDGSDGWGITIPAGTIPCGSNIALYAQIYDWAGNTSGVAVGSIIIPCEILYLPQLRR